jgi:hypothetical protein
MPGGGIVTYGTGGCISSARRQLFGTVLAAMRDAYLPQVIGQGLGPYLSQDRPYLAALRGWQRCMAAAQHPLASPAAAVVAVQVLAAARGTTARQLRDAQRSIAGADARCGRDTGLRARYRAGLNHYIHALPGRVLAQLRETYLVQLGAVRAAARPSTRSPRSYPGRTVPFPEPYARIVR